MASSPAQYELQFKKWGLAKNLKSGEWASLISQYDLLCQTKRDVQITVSGSALSKNKIDRARRRYRPRNDRSQRAVIESESIASMWRNEHGRAYFELDHTLPTSRQAHVEFLDDSGTWRKYSSAQARDANAVVLHKSARTTQPPLQMNGQLEHHGRLGTHGMDSDSDMALVERALGAVSSFHDPNPIHPSSSPPVNLDDFLTIPMPSFGSPSLAQAHTFGADDAFLWSLPLDFTILNGPLDYPPFLEASVGSSTQEDIAAGNGRQGLFFEEAISVAGTHSRLEGVRSFINSLVQHSKRTQCYNISTPTETEIPDVEEIMESLESLLSETEEPSRELSGLALSIKDDSSSSKLLKTLVYSFINNFAGLRDVPRKSLMHLLRDRHDIRTQLFEVIKSDRAGVVKPLAHNLFRAAVEGGDADAVATIIHHTKSNPEIAIDPNQIVCSLEDKDFTPIEMAAKFRNTELVRTLVASNADPNKTYRREDDKYWEKGALALVLGHWVNGSEDPWIPSPAGEPEPVDLDLLRLLLDCGAEIRMDLLENSMRPGPGNTMIAEELVSRIPASDHQKLFKSDWLLVSMVHYLDNSAANRLVRRIFVNCSDSKDCGDCAMKNPRKIEKILCHAARRSNLELSKFLMQHTVQLQSPLAAAVRASNQELVQFILHRGAHVDDPVEPWHPPQKFSSPENYVYAGMYDENGYDRPILSTSHPEYVVTPIRTPLAEAIRTGNNHLINAFERLGALARLDDQHHFEAAVLAAAEVGNTSYLKVLLHHGFSHSKVSCLTIPLAVAIRNEETAAALILLDAGANPYCNIILPRMYGDLLANSLERRNKQVVDSMLESDVYLRQFTFGGKTPIEIAGSWCEVDVIKDLTRLGSDINFGIKTTALGAAVRSRNKVLVHQLIDLGAKSKPAPLNKDELSPLRAALEVGDHDMMRFLISKGADSADPSAFGYAMDSDTAGYELLLSEFRSQHPHGLPGFGGSLLAKAIGQGSQILLDSLLDARADVNGWCTKGIWSDSGRPMRNQRVLGYAIKHHKGQCEELVRKLMDKGAETNLIVSEYQMTTDYEEMCVLETPLVLAIKTKNSTLVGLFLEYGADIDLPARRGVRRTPLQAACETGSYKMVEFLLQRGANVNSAAAERHGGTALQMAAKTGSLKIVKLLLDNGADPHMAKSKVGGRTAFEAAAENGCLDILCLLWNVVLPFGFSEKECQSAKGFAKQKGHRSCVDFIDFLSSGSSQSFLDQ